MKQNNYFEQERLKLSCEEQMLTLAILKREDNVCQLCYAKKQTEHLTIHTVREDRPSLDNTVCVCTSCKIRVIDSSEDNAKRLKLLFRPYLTRNEVKRYNEENPIVS